MTVMFANSSLKPAQLVAHAETLGTGFGDYPSSRRFLADAERLDVGFVQSFRQFASDGGNPRFIGKLQMPA